MLKGIMSIAGQPGLFKLVAEAKNSIIVESLITGKRMPAYSTSKISALEDIAIFTETGEVALKEVFKNISEKEEGGEVAKKGSGEELKAYFGEVLPEYDEDRVYVSDMKKVIQWYNLLQGKDLLNFEEDENNTEDQASEEEEA
ncbi:DUF5606 family protein [Sunxiuqinia elliptica]